MRTLLALAAAGLLASPAAAEKIDIKVVGYKELFKAIESHKGKVVLVDVWATWCIPCRKKFPHVVKLHEKFAKKGLVCLSLSVNDLPEKANALKFLKDQKATFANYLLKATEEEILPYEDGKAGKRKFPTQYPPIYHVFNRAGEQVKTFSGNFTGEELDALIEKLLAEKK